MHIVQCYELHLYFTICVSIDMLQLKKCASITHNLSCWDSCDSDKLESTLILLILNLLTKASAGCIAHTLGSVVPLGHFSIESRLTRSQLFQIENQDTRQGCSKPSLRYGGELISWKLPHASSFLNDFDNDAMCDLT